ncbi:putative C-S lyase, partial [Aliarcobacter butzleri]
KILDKYKKVTIKREINTINFFGYVKTKAGYENGSAIVKELKAYLMNNIIFTKDIFEKNNLKIDFFIPIVT